MKKIRQLYKLIPLSGPLKYLYRGDARFLYSNVFYSRTIKFNVFVRTVVRIISAGIWVYKASTSIRKLIINQGKQLKRNEQISIRKQLFSLLSIAFLKNAPPFYYYYLRLYNKGYKLCESYLLNRHYIPLYSNFLGFTASNKVLQNKSEFIKRLDHLRGEIVKSDLILSNYNKDELFGLYQNLQMDLFLKPVAGSSGRDCLLLETGNQGEIIFRTSDGLLSTENSTAILNTLLMKSDLLVQKRLHNHESLQELTNGSLASCRINTYIDERGAISPLFAMFLMPKGSSITSNGAKGSIISPIGLSNGKLGKAISLNKPFELYSQHPNGKGNIIKTVLPHWKQALNLCLVAHQSFMDLPFIGWDVALTKDGPKLLEGNLGWSIEAWQLTHKDTFDPNAFNSILKWHMIKKLAQLNH